jgi:hypothetical protein
MAEHYVHLTQTDLEDVLQHVWVAGPGAARPGELLSGPAERAPDEATAAWLHQVFAPTAAAIGGLEAALAGLGLLDEALACLGRVTYLYVISPCACTGRDFATRPAGLTSMSNSR